MILSDVKVRSAKALEQKPINLLTESPRII
jgi:hypothetical protein